MIIFLVIIIAFLLVFINKNKITIYELSNYTNEIALTDSKLIMTNKENYLYINSISSSIYPIDEKTFIMIYTYNSNGEKKIMLGCNYHEGIYYKSKDLNRNLEIDIIYYSDNKKMISTNYLISTPVNNSGFFIFDSVDDIKEGDGEKLNIISYNLEGYQKDINGIYKKRDGVISYKFFPSLDDLDMSINIDNSLFRFIQFENPKQYVFTGVKINKENNKKQYLDCRYDGELNLISKDKSGCIFKEYITKYNEEKNKIFNVN